MGYDKVDVTYATQKGIPVAISAGVNAASVSEHAVLLMLAVLRRLVEADGAVHQGLWADKSVLKNAGTIRGRTVGLLGFGNIAHMVAEKVSAFGARVQYYDVVRADPAVEERLHASYVPFEELMATSDIVSVHIPLLPQTTGMVDEKAIARMKPGTILINTARGGIVDEDALARALEEGRLRGAGLDTFAQEPPGTLEDTLLLLALLRLTLPAVLLPATTALATLHPRGRVLGMEAGANVVMPNLSPPAVRENYALYDGKAATGVEAAEHLADLRAQLAPLGLTVAIDRGDAPTKQPQQS